MHRCPKYTLRTTYILFLCTLALVTHMHAADIMRGYTFLSPRPQTANMARTSVGPSSTYQYATAFPEGSHLHAHEGWYVGFDVTPEYMQSFRSHRIAEYYFNRNTFSITGSQVENRNPTQDILADYFGLSPAYVGFSTLVPLQKQMICDFGIYAGYNRFYFTVHAPLTWVQTQVRVCDNILNTGADTPYPPLYMTTNALAAPFNAFSQAIAVQDAQSLRCANLCGTTCASIDCPPFPGFGDVVPRKYGNMGGPTSITALADLQMILGCNIIDREFSHVGLALTGTAPTGNKPTAIMLFEPIAGNGTHGQFGIRTDAHTLIWEKDGEQEVNFVVALSLEHFFPTRQRRSFDFKDLPVPPFGFGNAIYTGLGSRYILVKEFDATGGYTGVTLPAINVTTLWCDVHISLQLEMLFMLSYRYLDFGFDVGYNGWLRTREKIECLLEKIPERTYAFKGIQNTDTGLGKSLDTQSLSTWYGNLYIDQALVADPNPPVFLSQNHIDMQSAATPLQYTNKIFWHFHHTWQNYDPIGGFLGFGGEVEFEGIQPRYLTVNKPAINEWGLWLKGGITY